MGATADTLALVVLVLGALMGWHANRARAAHGDLRTTRGRIPGFKRTRRRSGLLAIVMLVIALIVIKDLISH
jgi:membrane protein required for beta-lactamase induction